jgi:hypothetical protein
MQPLPTLTDEAVAGRGLSVTGPETVTSSDLAELLSEFLGRSIEYVAIDEQTQRTHLSASGPSGSLHGLAICHESANAKGSPSVMTEEFESLVGLESGNRGGQGIASRATRKLLSPNMGPITQHVDTASLHLHHEI